MSTAVTASPLRRLRGNRAAWWVGGLLVVLVVVSFLARAGTEFGGSLDPANPQPDGARAVSQVLARHGVDVSVARGQAALLGTPLGPQSLVVVPDAADLGASTLRTLRRHLAGAGLVVMGSASDLGDLFGVGTAPVPSPRVAGTCTPGEDLPVQDLHLVTAAAAGLRAPGCFVHAGTSLLSHVDGAWLLSAPDVVANGQVLRADNAAVALRLLGQRPHLLWYVADLADTVPGDGRSVLTYLPGWLVPGLWLLLVAVVAFLLVRGRRLGPLSVERLPVVVRSAEAAEGRGRLYRRARAREHAADSLRRASAARMAQRLGLPPTAPWQEVAHAVARRTGRGPEEVAAVLAPRPLATDSALVDLGRWLQQLEHEIGER